MKKMRLLLAGAILCAGMLTCNAAVLAEEPEVKSTFEIAGTEVSNITGLVVKEGTIETVKEGDAEVSNVTLTDETGALHVFEKVDVEEWKDLKLIEEYEMFYIQYTDKTGKAREAEEKVEEMVWDQPLTMYSLGSVNVRTAPENGAEAIYYTSLGEECQALGIAPGWFKIKVGDGKEGYIYHKYLTEDKAVVDKLVEEAAQLAAYDDYSDDYSAPSGNDSSNNKKKNSGNKKKDTSKKQCLDNGLMN